MKKTVILPVLFLIFCFTRDALGQQIKNIQITRTNGFLCAGAELDKNIPEEIFEYLHNGVKVTIVYTVQLFRQAPFYYIFNPKQAEIDHKKIVLYNIWEKAYYLEEKGVSYRLQSKAEVNKRLKELGAVSLIEESRLKKDEEYYVRVRANLESVRLLPPLSWIYDLVTVRGFQTSWQTKNLK